MHYLRNVNIKIQTKIRNVEITIKTNKTNMRTHRNSNTEVPEQFWFCGCFRCDVPLFIVILVIYKYKNR